MLLEGTSNGFLAKLTENLSLSGLCAAEIYLFKVNNKKPEQCVKFIQS